MTKHQTHELLFEIHWKWWSCLAIQEFFLLQLIQDVKTALPSPSTVNCASKIPFQLDGGLTSGNPETQTEFMKHLPLKSRRLVWWNCRSGCAKSIRRCEKKVEPQEEVELAWVAEERGLPKEIMMNHKHLVISRKWLVLEAVIADARAQRVSEYWLMGDIFLPVLRCKWLVKFC